MSVNGRIMNVLSFGNNIEEIEQYAIDKAREFFGYEVELYIFPTYTVVTVNENTPESRRGKNFYATITVTDKNPSADSKSEVFNLIRMAMLAQDRSNFEDIQGTTDKVAEVVTNQIIDLF